MATIAPTIEQPFWRIALAVTVNASANKVEVQRSTNGGVTWLPVRGDDSTGFNPLYSNMVGTSRTVYDSELGLDTPTIYRCRGVNPTTGYVEAWSANTVAVTLVSSGCMYIIHPVDQPGHFVAVDVQIDPGFTTEAPRGKFSRLGFATPVVVMGVRHAAVDGSGFRIIATSDVIMARVRAVVGLDKILVVRAPLNMGWVHPYIVADTMTFTHRAPHQAGVWQITVPWTEVDSPASIPITAFGVTWQDVKNNYATWAAVTAAYASWNALIGAVL